MEKILSLNENTKGFYGEIIDRLKEPPSPLQFYRDYVSQNRPCIIENAINHWSALKKWDLEYLEKALKDENLDFDVTLDGYADAVRETELGSLFMQPEIQHLNFDQFLQKRKGKISYYLVSIYKENGFFSDEFKNLHKDIEELEWANESFGYPPEKTNIWFGDNRNVASLHNDEYENIYIVIRGEKHFTIYPPQDLPFLYPKEFTMATYETKNDELKVSIDEPKFTQKWYSLDPYNPNFDKYPLSKHATPYRIVLKAGECLYLPSLWFHHIKEKVDEENKVIAINFWYDMTLGPLYRYYKYLESTIDNMK